MRFLFQKKWCASIIGIFFLASVYSIEAQQSMTHGVEDTENDLINFIVNTYLRSFLNSNQSNKETLDSVALHHKAMHYAYSHPALRQHSLLVSKKNNHRLNNRMLMGEEKRESRNKKSLFPSEEICQTERKWELINKTIDVSGNEVEVLQDDYLQFVFTYRCANPGVSCTGISTKYDSECEERNGWMFLWTKAVKDKKAEAKWAHVSIPHHCACKLTKKLNHFYT